MVHDLQLRAARAELQARNLKMLAVFVGGGGPPAAAGAQAADYSAR
jgi:hypothetical protein